MVDDIEVREKELREIPPRQAAPATWPSGIRSIGIDEMDALGVDAEGIIYWHGKPLQIRQKFELRRWEFSLLVGATVGALLQGIAAMFPFVPGAISKVLGFG